MPRAPLAIALALSTLVLALSQPAHADAKTASESITKEESRAASGAASRAVLLPTALALVPGVAIHGLGHLAAGDRRTAFRLMRYELLGLGMASVAGAYLFWSGGSRYGNELSIPLMVSGSGLFFNSFLADVYGTASGGSSYGFDAAPRLSAQLGYGYVYDPLFAYRNFSVIKAHLELGEFQIEPSMWTAIAADNQRARMDASYDILHDDAGEHLRLGSAFTYHRFGDDGFTNFVGEFSLAARIEMSRLSESLRGSFTTMSYGLGAERTEFSAAESRPNNLALLLGYFGYGFYMPKAGELELYYEHRRDTFTAGLSPSTRNGSGFLGHLGVTLQQPLSRRLRLHAQAEIGSALQLGMGLEISLERQP